MSTPILIFFLVKTPGKISEAYDNPFWEKSNPMRERESSILMVCGYTKILKYKLGLSCDKFRFDWDTMLNRYLS